MFLPVLSAEEALLLSEFGEDYAAYRRRTWRLVPFLYEDVAPVTITAAPRP
jgi:protein-S-isoprenylcysteine O-methyltransferase Ste14